MPGGGVSHALLVHRDGLPRGGFVPDRRAMPFGRCDVGRLRSSSQAPRFQTRLRKLSQAGQLLDNLVGTVEDH